MTIDTITEEILGQLMKNVYKSKEKKTIKETKDDYNPILEDDTEDPTKAMQYDSKKVKGIIVAVLKGDTNEYCAIKQIPIGYVGDFADMNITDAIAFWTPDKEVKYHTAYDNKAKDFEQKKTAIIKTWIEQDESGQREQVVNAFKDKYKGSFFGFDVVMNAKELKNQPPEEEKQQSQTQQNDGQQQNDQDEQQDTNQQNANQQ